MDERYVWMIVCVCAWEIGLNRCNVSSHARHAIEPSQQRNDLCQKVLCLFYLKKKIDYSEYIQ